MKRIRSILNYLGIVTLILFSSCEDDDQGAVNDLEGERIFILENVVNDNFDGVHIVLDDVESGTVSTVEGQELQRWLRYNVWVVDSTFILSGDQAFFKAYVDPETNLIEELGTAPNNLIPFSGVWLNDNQFVTFSRAWEYAIYEHEPFRLVTTGELEPPAVVNDDIWIGLGVSFLHNDKIYHGFSVGSSSNSVVPEVGFVVINPETMEVESILKDDRTGGHGQPNNNRSFEIDGYIYFITMASNWWFGFPDKPSTIMRITPEGEIDPDFMFNLSEKAGGKIPGTSNFKYHSDGIFYYTGNGKFLVKMCDEELIEEYQDYSNPANGVYSKQYYIADINAGTMTKLDVPNSFSPYGSIVEFDGKFAFPVNTADGNYIYIYNSATGEVNQGISIEGTRFIRRIQMVTN